MCRLALLVCVLLIASAAEAVDRFVDNVQQGSGNCSSFANACQFQAGGAGAPNGALTLAGPSDVIRVSSGTPINPKVYQGANNMIVPPVGKSGTSGAPITIRAEVEGGVRIDGQFVREPIFLQGNSWWDIEGFNAKNAGPGFRGVLTITGIITNVNFRRLVLHDSHIDGTYVIQGAPDGALFGSNIIMEDIAAFGTGRKMFVGGTNTQGAPGTIITCRRCWFRAEGSTESGPTIVETGYKSFGFRCENCLITWSGESMPETYFGFDDGNFGQQRTNFRPNDSIIAGITGWQRDAAGKCQNAEVLGSLIYLLPSSRPTFSSDWWGHADSCVTLKHIVSFIPPTHPEFSVLRDMKLTDGEPAFGTAPATPGTQIAHNITSVRGVAASVASSWNVGSGSTAWSVGTSLGAVSNPWTNTGAGANLCMRWVNGVVTNTPLWPWPMNQRIKDATEQAGSYTGPCGDGAHPCVGGRLARTATDVTAQIESILGAIPTGCRTEGGPQPPPSTGVLVRYFHDEAASGTAPAASLDSSGVGTALDLTNTYGGNMAYTAPGTGRGLDWTTAGGAGTIKAAIDGTKAKTTLQGKQRITMAAATNLDALASATQATTDCRLAISLETATKALVTVNDKTAFWNVSSLTGSRHVLHAVIDTTQSLAANRMRLYIDGADQGDADGGTFPAQSETLDLLTGKSLTVGNTVAGDQSPNGIVGFSAFYDEAFSPSKVSTEAAAIASTDDSGGGGGGGGPPTAIIYDGQGAAVSSTTVAALTPGLPGPQIAVGNQLVTYVFSRTTGSAPTWTVTTPSGATWGPQIGSTCHQTGTRNIALAAFRREAGLAESAPVVTISDVGLGHFAVVAMYRNVDAGTPLDIAAGCVGSGAQATFIPTSVVTQTIQALAVVAVATPDLNALAFQSGQSQGFTLRLGGTGWQTSNGPIAVGLADVEKATAGTVTMPTWEQTANGVDEWISLRWAWRLSGQSGSPPPAGGGGNTPILRPLVGAGPLVSDTPLVTPVLP